MELHTFNVWSQMGYKILKGSKATWIDNVPMFSDKQVVKMLDREYVRRHSWYQADYDYDDPMTFDNWMDKH